MLIHLLTALSIVTGIAGQLLVANRNPKGFYAWIGTNFALAGVAWLSDTPALIALYVFQTGACFYSIKKWAEPLPVATMSEAVTDVRTLAQAAHQVAGDTGQAAQSLRTALNAAT